MKKIVVWLTGMSGAGKTTIAKGIYTHLVEQGQKVKLLDGDEIRNNFHPHLSFSPDDIIKNNELIVQMCESLKTDFNYILVSIISPFKCSRLYAREVFGTGFVEVFVKASVKTLIERDVKGLYKKALSGEIDNFIGISPTVPYEPPENPEIIINTEKITSFEAIEIILKLLKKHKQ